MSRNRALAPIKRRLPQLTDFKPVWPLISLTLPKTGTYTEQVKLRASLCAVLMAAMAILFPPALRARLQTDDNRLRVPTWEELQELSPEERRLVVDYFRRLSQPSSR